VSYHHDPTENKTDDVKDSFCEELERVFDNFPKYHTKILLGDFNAKVGSDQIPEELIQAGGKMFLSAIHKLINSIWNKEELPNQWKEFVIVPVQKRVTKLTVIIIVG
jgi:hypothetical protein